MKKLLFILVFTISACSPNDDSAQFTTLKSIHLESDLSLNYTENVFYIETFENGNLDFNPSLSNFYPEFALDHSFNLKSDVDMVGNSSGRFEIRKDDPQIWGGTRAEYSQSWHSARSEGWFGFSQFFPNSYETDPVAEIVGQWHDKEDVGEFAGRSPSNSLQIQNDRFRWQLRWDVDRIMENGTSDGHIYIDLGPVPKDRWIDWVVHINFSHTNKGILEVWKDGVKVIDRQNLPNSYNDENYPYMKLGIYKWLWGNVSEKIMYWDEVRIGSENSIYEEVQPNRINIMINSYTVNCFGERERNCLLVQEGEMIGTDNWENFHYYDSIEGFEYEPGFIYGLFVKKTKLENPPADGSSLRYELVKIVSKEVPKFLTSDPTMPGNRGRGHQKRALKN